MSNNFFITGTGRCGSLWLASALDAALLGWTVTHEPEHTNSVFNDLKLTQAWLNDGEKRGVIDCRLRPVADMVVASRRVVLVRHPVSVWDSTRRRNKKDRRWFTPDCIVGMCHRIDSLIQEYGFDIMRFEDAIESPSYVADILGLELGSKWTVKKMNASPRTESTPVGLAALVRTETRWFADRYKLGEI